MRLDSRREQKLRLLDKGPWHCYWYTRTQSQQADLLNVGEVMTVTYMFLRQMEPWPTTDRRKGNRQRLGLCQGGSFTSYFPSLVKGGDCQCLMHLFVKDVTGSKASCPGITVSMEKVASLLPLTTPTWSF